MSGRVTPESRKYLRGAVCGNARRFLSGPIVRNTSDVLKRQKKDAGCIHKVMDGRHTGENGQAVGWSHRPASPPRRFHPAGELVFIERRCQWYKMETATVI